MTKLLLAAILALGTTTMAFAEPVEMTAKQLDQVTAGFTITSTQSFTLTTTDVAASLVLDSHFELKP